MSREIFLDFETEHRKGVSLKNMTLRQYLAAAAVLGVSVAEGDEDPTWFPADCPEWPTLLTVLREAALEEDTIFIAHNAAFDIRVMRYGWTKRGGPLNLPQPQRVRCSLELACGAWPNQPGGYGLEVLSKTLNLGLVKLGKGSDVGRMSPQELELYCNQDTRMCRAIYRRAVAHLHPDELALAEAANRCRELYLNVSADKVEAAVAEFGQVASEEVEAALERLGEGGDLAFGWDGTRVKSVKAAQLRDLLLDNLGFDTRTTSAKKINPEKLRANAAAAEVVGHVSKAQKALYTVRKSKVFRGAQVADVELGYCLAEGSPVLTKQGFRPIEGVVPGMHVWDGTGWVVTSGVVDKGVRACISVGGVWMTPDHRVLTSRGMERACRLHERNFHLLARPGVGGRLLLLPGGRTEGGGSGWSLSDAAGVASNSQRPSKTWRMGCPASAYPVPGRSTTIPSTRTLSRTISYDGTGGIGGTLSKKGALTLGPVSGRTMVEGELKTRSPRAASSYNTSGLSRAGIRCQNPSSRSTVSTTTATTRLGICGSSLSGKTSRTVRRLRVFDLLNAGPRHRFQAGGLIVSNCRAHTGRYSCPAVGKGINLHGLGKRDKRMAKITRSMFSLQDPLCWVRADLANVEYRVGGLLYGCEHIVRLFEADVLADPYSAFWLGATGRRVTKADPERAVPKQAVLQLEYLAGLENWTGVLQQCLADPSFGATLADLERMCETQGWGPPATANGKRVMTRTRAPWQVVSVAEHARDLFHKVHPEFRAKTKWLENTVHQASRTLDYDTGNRLIDRAYTLPGALDRNLVNLHWDGRFEGASIRVRCGNWPAETVTWRDLGLRPIGLDGGMCMSAMSGRKGYRPLRTTVMIENIVQSAARNAGCQAKLELTRRGYPWVYSVHDEIMLAVPRTREWVLRARQDFLDVLGPNRLPGWKWSVLINPDEITVTRTMWEVEPGQLLPPIGEKNGKPVYPKNHVWWDRLAAGEESLLENLP